MNSRRLISILLTVLVLFLAACGGSETPSEDPSSLDEGAALEIDPEAIYTDRCARCHGADRSGAKGPALLPEALTQDAALYQATIMEGSGSMPSFSSRLTTDEISALLEFILSEPE